MDKDLILSEEKGERKLMVNGSGLRVNGHIGSWFKVQDSWLKINELLDGREEKLF